MCDAGCINYYLKTFPGAGVDVFVGMEGMCVGPGYVFRYRIRQDLFCAAWERPDRQLHLQRPTDAKDPRLVRFGGVPAIAFSEAMGDLARIAGKPETKDAEAAHA